ncbi:MAG TPA: hypothetical protein VMN04_00490 [Thermoanaerobaculia bacterium]|nr:hypothetical protein [Thermoanaerobaculia bacterium]
MAEDEGPLSARISRADRRALLALVSENLARLTERDASQALRHPHASEAMIVEILGSRTLMASRAIRRLVAGHPQTPRHDALHALDDLLWRDLMDIGRDTRTPPPVRQAANRRLLEALRRMAAGEKVAVARFAHPDLFPALFAEGDPLVLEALLQNPRLTPDDIQRWLATGSPSPNGLALLAAEPRWAHRPAVRSAILLHPATPRASALSLLTSASREELRRVCGTPGADALLAACAANLLEKGPNPVDRPR